MLAQMSMAIALVGTLGLGSGPIAISGAPSETVLTLATGLILLLLATFTRRTQVREQ